MSDIEKYINEHGQECYRGVTAETPFSPDLFHMPEKQFEDERQWAFHSELGSLTVVDRMTGFGWRDVESGYRDKDGKFWLASGNYDVRGIGCKTVGEAIQWLKERANTCDPDYKPEPEPEDAKDTRIAELEAKLADAEADAHGCGAELSEISKLLPGVKYMDPPDGGSVTVAEQFRRMAEDAARYRWLRDNGNIKWSLDFDDMVISFEADPRITEAGAAGLDAAIDAARGAK